ncbi:2-amino-4-hydroxy-6-hydroxymethyldihydropteridine diphosphokinase [Pseudomarimonas salicorniae]|uniref:2-amino-4-hydroxy-6-hydroxymethyldihydropteridine pyrophosphokinase n=1 Tax=Pseudomarimonas salicorniae TaxID=2933270 RepID=A0ABT0GM44_9GAMM|nr:2-amino-4-hydroxy-6-hydroxymethyldihydropteridine diphosphokinase [Lysobacter sp. CAU 1642]MCK7595442.1 2-amino-4-hydroxy-6-hydroxymethyldihydropteridine diphosphokinase [Lysobacter sp. CAU 1642]
MALAWVGLGSNLDDPPARLREALEHIAALEGVFALRSSPFYRAPPWGPVAQPDFVNAVAEFDARLAPEPLLEALLSIERRMGRERRERWGPRRIDLDLLHMEGESRAGDRLELPHPRIAERAFVLCPWRDLAPTLELPGLGRIEALAKKVDCSNVQPLP